MRVAGRVAVLVVSCARARAFSSQCFCVYMRARVVFTFFAGAITLARARVVRRGGTCTATAASRHEPGPDRCRPIVTGRRSLRGQLSNQTVVVLLWGRRCALQCRPGNVVTQPVRGHRRRRISSSSTPTTSPKSTAAAAPTSPPPPTPPQPP